MKRLLFLLCLSLACAGLVFAQERRAGFSQFAATLPPGWDGDEQTGFISDNPAEYLLTFSRKDESGDNVAAQVSIYLLPNKPGASAQGAAKTLTESQGDASEPKKVGQLWQFTGEPRSRTVKGRATTWVNADPELLLIIIAQDPQALGAAQIVESLAGQTPQARRMLGR